MKTAITLISLFLCVLFNACSKDNNPEDSIEYAPISIQDKSMRLCTSSAADSWFVDITQTSNNNVTVIPHDKSWKITDTYSTYQKINENTAKFNLEYTINISGTEVSHYLEVILTFTSENGGIYNGTDEIESGETENTAEISGYFIIENNGSSTPDDNGHIDFDYLCNSWKYTYGNTIKYLVFSINKTYNLILKGDNNLRVKGTYSYDKNKNLLYLKEDGDSESTQYKISTLTANRMEIAAYMEEAGKYGSPEIYNKTNDNIDSEANDNINISTPVIEDITTSSALVKGTILGDNIKERGVCYSTHSLPTIDDNVNKVNTDVINITLSNLNNATKYYARFYAKVGEEIKYGKESFFQTLGVSTSNILLTLTGISTYGISLKAKFPNTINTFGICYSTSPKPKITNSYIDEAFKKEEWVISPTNQNETYYIRAYHIDGNQIIYYDDSEIAVETLGKSIKIENVITYSEKSEQQRYIAPITYKYTEYKNPILRVSYSGLPKGAYETTITIEKAWYVDSYEGKFKSYIDKSSGQMEYSISKSWSNHQKINTYLKCIETGIEYQNSNYGYEQRIK